MSVSIIRGISESRRVQLTVAPEHFGERCWQGTASELPMTDATAVARRTVLTVAMATSQNFGGRGSVEPEASGHSGNRWLVPPPTDAGASQRAGLVFRPDVDYRA